MYANDVPLFDERLPYVAAVVDLAEGVRVMTNVVDCDGADLRIGMALTVDYRPESASAARLDCAISS